MNPERLLSIPLCKQSVVRLLFAAAWACWGCFSAGAQAKEGRTSLQLGLTMSHLPSDSLHTRPYYSPSAGAAFAFPLGAGFGGVFNARFTGRGFNAGEYNARLRNRYLDLEGGISYGFLPSMEVMAGFSVHHQYRSLLKYRDPGAAFDDRILTETGWASYADAWLGLELELQEHTRLGLRAYPRLGARIRQGFEFYLSFTMPGGEREPGWEEQRRAEAEAHITAMKDGILLMRLQSLDRSLEALRRAGMPLKAAEWERKLEVQNRELMQAFASEFSFCEVYFFHARDSREVLAGNWEGRVFGASEQAKVPDSPGGRSLYIADTGPLPADTSLAYEDYALVRDENGARVEKVQFMNRQSQFGALSISDAQERCLHRPFPYYVRTWGDLFFLRDARGVVRSLDEKLWMYYRKTR